MGLKLFSWKGIKSQNGKKNQMYDSRNRKDPNLDERKFQEFILVNILMFIFPNTTFSFLSVVTR